MNKELEALERVKEYLEEIGISKFNIHTLEAIDDDINCIKQALQELEKLKSKVRELYTKPERKNGKLENSFDYFIRAEETKNRVIKELKQLAGEDNE